MWRENSNATKTANSNARRSLRLTRKVVSIFCDKIYFEKRVHKNQLIYVINFSFAKKVVILIVMNDEYLDKHMQAVSFDVVQFSGQQKTRSGTILAVKLCDKVAQNEFLKIYV